MPPETELIIDVGEDPQEQVQPKDGRGVRKRTEEERDSDLEVIADMTSRRKSQRDIQAHLNSIRHYSLSLAQVQKDQRKLDRYYINRNGALTREQKRNKELLAIERQEAEAWDAWERSKQDGVTQRQETYDADSTGKQKTKKVIEKERNVGDPRFLQVLIALREQRIRMEGLDEPTKMITEVNATIHNGVNMDNLREAFRKRVLAEEVERQAQEPQKLMERFPVNIPDVTLSK